MSLLPVLLPSSPIALAYGRVGSVRDLSPAVCATESYRSIPVMMREDPRHAVRVIAGWLSTREAIWWGAICQSQLMSLGEAMPEPGTLAMIIRWVQNPLEETRIPLAELAEKPESNSLGYLVSAVVLTADSLSPLVKSPVPTPGGLAHRMVGLSILAAADQWPLEGRAGCLGHFLELGVDISENLYPWDKDNPQKHPGLRTDPEAGKKRKRLGNIWENW